MDSAPATNSRIELLRGRLRHFKYRFSGWKAHVTYNVAHLPKRIVSRNVIHAYWYNRVVNFGDIITPALLGYYGYTPVHAYPTHASLASTGSILQLLPSNFSGIILGSGLVSEKEAKRFESATILGVRGTYTRELIQAAHDTILGDPGLLLPQLSKELPARKYLIGLVPHYADKDHETIEKILERYPTQARVIEVQRDPISVLHETAQCEYILSSSLHGLVLADALGIPNAWMVLSDKLAGHGFKFKDYFSAFDCNYESVSLTGDETLEQLASYTHNPSPEIPIIQARLDKLFQELPHILR